MTNSVPNTTRFRLDNVRIAFPTLFKAEQVNGEGKYRCGAQLILPKDHPQFAQLKEAVQTAAKIKWKDKAAAMLKAAYAKGKVTALYDGDSKPQYSGFAGMWAVSANCRGGDSPEDAVKPTVMDGKREKITEAGKNPIYAGCYVNALIEVYANDQYGAGVFATLVGVQFRKDGDAFGTAPAREDDFEETEGAEADDLA